MSDLNIDGTVVAGGVAEIIICLAVSEVEGVAAVGGMGAASGIKGLFSGHQDASGIELETGEDGGLYVGVHVEVFYGYVLPEVAAKIRTVVAGAVESQLGAKVDQVDVFVDDIRFAE